MDQDAFRTMLASGSAASSSNRSRGVLGGPAPKRGGWGIKAKPGHEYKPPKEEGSTGFLPRNQKRRPQGKDEAEPESKYTDRAERRRKGLDDEYKPVEQLLEDLERRQKEEGMDQGQIDKQRAYLGGDATHSILVKGLDFALLARRKAELAAQGEEVADEELEELANRVAAGRTPAPPPPKAAEPMAKGFKSITATSQGTATSQDAAKPKAKKKKKKAKEQADASLSVKPLEETITQAGPEPGPSKAVPKVRSPPPVDDDEDIFGDAGAYDLTNGRPEDSDSETGDEADRQDTKIERSRSRSSSRETHRGRHQHDRSRSGSRDRYRYEEKKHSDYYGDHDRRGQPDYRDRYHRRDRSRSGDYHRARSRSIERQRHERTSARNHWSDRDRGEAEDTRRSKQYGNAASEESRRGRESSHWDDRDRYNRGDGNRQRHAHRRGESPSRSPPPEAKRSRQATRSPSPLLFDPHARARSPTLSESDEDEHLVNGKLRPLQSSAIADVKGYLSAEAAAAEADEKKARKAKWRARQGLGLQEGSEKYLEREVGDKEKLNRDYVKVMGKLKKDEEKEQ